MYFCIYLWREYLCAEFIVSSILRMIGVTFNLLGPDTGSSTSSLVCLRGEPDKGSLGEPDI